MNVNEIAVKWPALLESDQHLHLRTVSGCPLPQARFGAPGRARTCNLRGRNSALYPLSYGRLARRVGFEPTTSRFEAGRSVQLMLSAGKDYLRRLRLKSSG